MNTIELMLEASKLAVAVLKGYPQSMAREDALITLRNAIAAGEAELKREPVAWEYRAHYDDNTSTPGWGEWERLVPRNLYTDTIENRVQEIRDYINSGYKYQLRALIAREETK